MEDRLHINPQMIRPILHEDVGKKEDLREGSSSLTDKQKKHVVTNWVDHHAVPKTTHPLYSSNLPGSRLFTVP